MPIPSTNFLEAKPAVGPSRAPKRRWWLAVLLAVVGLMILAVYFGLVFYFAGLGLVAHTESGLEHVRKIEGTADMSTVLAEVALADQDFRDAQLDLLALKPLTLVPQLRPKLAAADNLLEGARLAISALEPVGQLLARDEASWSTELDFLNMTDEERHRILAFFYDYRQLADQTEERLSRSIELLSSVEASELGEQAVELLPGAIDRLKAIQVPLSYLSPASRLLPPLLGYPEPRNYLIFLQNNTELRPTGGFLGVYGVARVANGRLLSLETDDIYALDGPSESTERPAPPEPIRRYIRIDNWYLRDANWSPDWPTSVDIMERFFHEEAVLSGRDVQPIDGVIGLTPEPVAALLRLTGPITVDGKTFDAENLVDELEFQVEQNYIEEGLASHERKDIIGDLANELLAKLFDGSALGGNQGATYFLALTTLSMSAAEGHVLFWFRDPDLQQFVLEHDLGGEMQPVEGDYLSLIDANLAAFKSDRVVDRTVSYTIRPEGDRYRASVSLTYDHHGSFDWKTTRYRTYVRAYVPPGSEFLEVRGAMVDDKLRDPARRPGTADVYDELDRTVFGAFISIEPGQQGTITFDYLLPPEVSAQIAAGTYHLLVEKQPGTIAHGLTLDLDFGKNLTSAEPPEDPSEFGDNRFRYDSDLQIDREFTIGLVK